MMAIGGAIGTGLFLGAGGRLNSAGPALAIVYAICGLFAFFVVRALGELVLHRPSSGAFVAGWMYFPNWATTGIADITATAIYAHYWSMFSDIPQWILALIMLAVVLSLNLVSVKIFGEMEFWFAIITPRVELVGVTAGETDEPAKVIRPELPGAGERVRDHPQLLPGGDLRHLGFDRDLSRRLREALEEGSGRAAGLPAAVDPVTQYVTLAFLRRCSC